MATPRRSTSSLKRPARSIEPLSTSSSGSTSANRRWSCSLIVTPSSSRSRPLRHVPESSFSSLNGARWPASRPQRMPLSAIHSSTRVSASSSSRKRRRTGSRSAKSITCEAVSRSSASSSSRATTPSTGFVWRSERSASRTRRSGSPAGSGSPSTTMSPAPNVAWMSGAKTSMSGHITITSRGSSAASSSIACRIASRRTSTWRARPWQAWTSTLRSSGSSGGRASAWPGCGAPGGAVSSRTPAWRRASSEPVGCSTGCSVELRSGPSTSWSSRASCPHEPSSRFSGASTVGSSARRVTRGVPSSRRHSAGDGCRRKSRTSRWSASASSTRSWPAGSRVRPNSEKRGGRSARAGSARSRAHAAATREAGSGTSRRAFRRRQSSGCQCSPSPPAQAWMSSGRCSA